MHVRCLRMHFDGASFNGTEFKHLKYKIFGSVNSKYYCNRATSLRNGFIHSLHLNGY